MRQFYESAVCPICGQVPYVVIETTPEQGKPIQQEVYCIRCRRNLAIFQQVETQGDSCPDTSSKSS